MYVLRMQDGDRMIADIVAGSSPRDAVERHFTEIAAWLPDASGVGLWTRVEVIEIEDKTAEEFDDCCDGAERAAVLARILTAGSLPHLEMSIRVVDDAVEFRLQ